ncbi:MAG TPA: glycosyltransferase family 9 protein, partial [Azospirillaceae bacterium]|nr:glycosyltransferase family 9 protein [Azospirillaceae bacterium]HRQ82343.1 glycosyltransferase family 9 protein [Azospirillaceae bacterium]
APRARPAALALADLGAVDLIGVGDLATSAACIARAGLFIGNDSGLMHIAAAAGVPTLGLFGPGYPEIYGPWGPNAAVVVSAVPAEELRARVTPQNKSPPGLMDGVSVDAVINAAVRLLTDKTVS